MFVHSLYCSHMQTHSTVPTDGRFVDPATAVSQFHIKPGDTVADIGAGSGFFMEALVQAVGPDGVVYASEIQRPLLEKLSDTARRRGFSQVHPVWGDVEREGGTKIPSDAADVVIMVNTFFQLEEVLVALREVQRILRNGGKFFVIDWSESFAGLGPQPEQVVTAANAIDALETAGFIFEREFPAGEHHYGLSVRNVKNSG